MSDQLRVDRASIQNHTDATRGTVGTNRGLGEDVNRQQANLEAQREGGVGSDEISRQRSSTNRHMGDMNTNIERTSNRTSEKGDEFISQVRNSANKSFDTI